jgi:hypothetical protein
MTMKTRILAMATVVLSLAACVQKVTEVPGLDRVLTAGEFSTQRALRDRVLHFCANDPSRYRQDPNCVNSLQSARVTAAGSGQFPRLGASLSEGSKEKK